MALKPRSGFDRTSMAARSDVLAGLGSVKISGAWSAFQSDCIVTSEKPELDAMSDRKRLTLKLKSNPWQRLMLVAISACFVAMGACLVVKGELLAGWLCIIFFGLGVAIGCVSLMPGSNYLDLKREGIELRSLYRMWFVRWDDVHEFIPISVSHRSMVGRNPVSHDPAQRHWRRLSAGLSGVESALPDTYGMSAEKLAVLLNDWRRRHSSTA